LEQLLTPIS